MEYKTLGNERSPDDELVAGLRALCDLDQVQREALAAWFESTADFNTYSSTLPAGIASSTLLPEQFRKTAAPIRFLLSSWHRRSLQLEDIERDLLLLGLDSAERAAIVSFLRRVAEVRERVWLDGLEGNAQIIGLPTLDDANIVWDARAVFGGASYYHFDGDADSATYQQCCGLTCVAIVEFMVSDTNGTKQRIALQMNEDIFKAFARAVDRSNEQLASLKAFIKPLPSSLQR